MDSKETLQKKAETQFDELKARIEEIQAKSRDDAILDDLRQKQKRVEEQIRVFESASGESWRVFAADMNKAINDLKNAVEKVPEKFD